MNEYLLGGALVLIYSDFETIYDLLFLAMDELSLFSLSIDWFFLSSTYELDDEPEEWELIDSFGSTSMSYLYIYLTFGVAEFSFVNSPSRFPTIPTSVLFSFDGATLLDFLLTLSFDLFTFLALLSSMWLFLLGLSTFVVSCASRLFGYSFESCKPMKVTEVSSCF